LVCEVFKEFALHCLLLEFDVFIAMSELGFVAFDVIGVEAFVNEYKFDIIVIP